MARLYLRVRAPSIYQAQEDQLAEIVVSAISMGPCNPFRKTNSYIDGCSSRNRLRYKSRMADVETRTNRDFLDYDY